MDEIRSDRDRQVICRNLQEGDLLAWRALRQELWPDESTEDASAWLRRRHTVTVVAEDRATAELIGFAEAGEREFADGCDTSPVAFLEGWYVAAARRGQGVGAVLVEGVVAWARSAGYSELASDSLLEDEEAFRAHMRVGFLEVERSIKYRMDLG